MIIKREKYLNKILKDLSKLDKILFVIWARQVWKTTILQSLLKFGYIPAENTLFLQGDKLLGFWISDYNSFISFLKNKISIKKLKYLIIDEAQYIPNIGLILKILIDDIRLKKFNFKVIVSGSGSLNIFRWMTDSLIWRKTVIKIYPLDWEEFLIFKWEKNLYWLESWRIKYYENLFNEYLLFWWYPKVVLTEDFYEKFELFNQILQDYIYKDIALLLKENEILKFQEFLKLIASKIWSKINISDIVQQLWIKRYVYEKFFFIIENTFLLEKIQPFVWWNVSKELKKYYKVYFNDLGMLRYLLGLNQWIWDFKWKVVENFVFNFINVNKNSWQKIMYWNTASGAEVDFIVQDQVSFKLIPIEAKNKDKDNFWKSYINFFKAYNDQIDFWVIVTSSLIKQRQLNWKTVKFLPYKLIHNLKFTI